MGIKNTFMSMKIMIIWFVFYYICTTTASRFDLAVSNPANRNKSILSIDKISLQRQVKPNNNGKVLSVNVKTDLLQKNNKKLNSNKKVNIVDMKKKKLLGNVSQIVKIREAIKNDSKENLFNKKITKKYQNSKLKDKVSLQHKVKSKNNGKIVSVSVKRDFSHSSNKVNKTDWKKKKLIENVPHTVKARVTRKKYSKKDTLNKKITRYMKTLVNLHPNKKFVTPLLKHLSGSKQVKHSTIQTLTRVQTKASLLINAEHKSKHIEQPVAKRNIFIDIATLEPFSPRMGAEAKEFRSTFKKSNKSQHNIDYSKKYERNADEAKRKVLTRLNQLENEIKLFKSQIENDSRTIQELRQQMYQKEKERVSLLLIKENTAASKFITDKLKDKIYISTVPDNSYSVLNSQSFIISNMDDEDTKTIINKKPRLSIKHLNNNGKLNKLNEIKFKVSQKLERDTANDTAQSARRNFPGNINIEHHHKMYEPKINTSSNNITYSSETTPSIFDLYDDLETYENFEGEFDWGKFFTSSMYYGLLKNRTANPIDGRRKLNNKNVSFPETLTSPIIYPGEDPIYDKGVKEKVDFLNDYILDRDITDPRDEILFAHSPMNKTTSDLVVPRPGDQWFIPKTGGLLSKEEGRLKFPYDTTPYASNRINGRQYKRTSTITADIPESDPLMGDDEAIGF